MSDPKRIVVGVPTYDGKMEFEMRHSLMDVMRRLVELGFSPYLHEEMGSGICFNRHKCAEVALTDNADYLLFIDADTVCKNLDIVNRLLAHDVDIVSAITHSKQPPFIPLACMWNEQNKNWRPISSIPENALCQVEATGCGFMLIKTDVFRKTPRPWFLCVDRGDSGWPNTGEDYYFCWKAAEAGHKVWVDTTPGMFHMGRYGYSEREYYQRQRAVEAKKTKLIIPEGVVS